MNVLLVNPRWPWRGRGYHRYRRAWPPLDLLNTAARLRKDGHLVSLLDARAGPVGPNAADQFVAGRRADLILLQTTPLDRWQCPDLDWSRLAGLVEGLPRDRLVVAGAHGTVFPELVLRLTGARAVLRGEPEAAFPALVAAGGCPNGLPGLTYCQAGRIVQAPPAPLADLDAQPGPAYDLLDPDRYRYELLGPRLALLETTRGCPFHCSFCFQAMYGPGQRTKTLETVLEEVELIVRWGAKSVYFFDLEFTCRREATTALCRELARRRPPLAWCCQTRVDAVDRHLLALMREAGCRLIHFGIETGSPRLLAETGKKTTVEQARRAVAWCRELGIETACFFLLGLPGETPGERRATRDLARALNPTYASFHLAAPYPGTRLATTTGKQFHPTMPFPPALDLTHLPELGRAARRAFLAYYLRPGYLWGRLREGGLAGAGRKLSLFWKFIR